MYDYLPHNIKLWLLQMERRKWKASDVRKLNAVPPEDRDLLVRMLANAAVKDAEFEGRIMGLQSQHLLDQIESYSLPPPEQSDWATENPFSPHRYFTREAYYKLKALVRAEKRERQEMWLKWVPAITGIGGLIVALVAMLTTRH